MHIGHCPQFEKHWFKVFVEYSVQSQKLQFSYTCHVLRELLLNKRVSRRK